MKKGESPYRKGLWTVEEDKILMDYVKVNGKGQWNKIAKKTGHNSYNTVHLFCFFFLLSSFSIFIFLKRSEWSFFFVPRTGLKRCGKSCRLRWINYLNPNVKKGDFSEEEEDLIIRLHKLLGNRFCYSYLMLGCNKNA